MGKSEEFNPPYIQANNISRENREASLRRKDTVVSHEALVAGKELATERIGSGWKYVKAIYLENLNKVVEEQKNEFPDFVQIDSWTEAFFAREIAIDIDKFLKDNPDLKSILYDPITKVTDPAKIAEILKPMLIKYYKISFEREQKQLADKNAKPENSIGEDADMALLKQIRENRLKEEKLKKSKSA